MVLSDDTSDALEASLFQMRKVLAGLEPWLDAAIAYATARSFDPGVLLTARLAPDQMPLVRQIQGACDRAKFAAARLSGKVAPRHPDAEQTVVELRERIQSCLSYLDTFVSTDFVAADSRVVEIPFLDNKAMKGRDYMRELALPGFYFHITTAYAILRHNGVELTMRDFIGTIRLFDRRAGPPDRDR